MAVEILMPALSPTMEEGTLAKWLVKEGDVVLPDGSTYTGGCWAHNERCCPFMHPGEESLYVFPDNRALRLVNGEAPKLYNNAVYYSTKSQAKPVAAKPQSTFKDSWD